MNTQRNSVRLFLLGSLLAISIGIFLVSDHALANVEGGCSIQMLRNPKNVGNWGVGCGNDAYPKPPSGYVCGRVSSVPQTENVKNANYWCVRSDAASGVTGGYTKTSKYRIMQLSSSWGKGFEGSGPDVRAAAGYACGIVGTDTTDGLTQYYICSKSNSSGDIAGGCRIESTTSAVRRTYDEWGVGCGGGKEGYPTPPSGYQCGKVSTYENNAYYVCSKVGSSDGITGGCNASWRYGMLQMDGQWGSGCESGRGPMRPLSGYTCNSVTSGNYVCIRNASGNPTPTSGVCGSNNGKTFPKNGPDQRYSCTSGAVSGIPGTEPSGTNTYALFVNGEFAGWDWTCGGQGKCFACKEGFTAQSDTCVKNGTNSPTNPSPPEGGCSGIGCNPSQVTSCSQVGGQCINETATCRYGAQQFVKADCTMGKKCCVPTDPPSPGSQCGTSHGKDFTSQPTQNLCSGQTITTGIGMTHSTDCSGLTGSGGRCAHWTWPCGTNTCMAWDVSGNTGPSNPIAEGEVIKVSGSCGNAARNYSDGETAFSGSFCYTGLPDPVNPSFPSINAASEWRCAGITGGKDSESCTATRGTVEGQNPTFPNSNGENPSSCARYTSLQSSIPEGYGSPFNMLSSQNEETLTVRCSDQGGMAVAGSQATFVYKTGFVSQNGEWRKIDFSGRADSGNAGWFRGSAVAELPAAPSSGQNYVLAFICQYEGSEWKCGCRDRDCSQNYWTIQAYGKK